MCSLPGPSGAHKSTAEQGMALSSTAYHHPKVRCGATVPDTRDLKPYRASPIPSSLKNDARLSGASQLVSSMFRTVASAATWAHEPNYNLPHAAHEPAQIL
jgi:hypothetical protein